MTQSPELVEVTQADMAYAKSIVEAVEHGCTYEDRCLAVRDLLARHRIASAAHQAELVDALEEIAAPCFVSLDDCPDYDQPNGWRDLAVTRVDIARAILAKVEGAA